MTEADISALEGRFALRLPDFYRGFLLAYPDALRTAKKDFGWMQEAPSERQLADDVGRLVELNDYVRECDAPWTADDGPWPRRYFVIGDDQCGNYWCLELSHPEPGVWFYDHDTGNFERQYPSLTAFAEELLREVESWNQDRASGLR